MQPKTTEKILSKLQLLRLTTTYYCTLSWCRDQYTDSLLLWNTWCWKKVFLGALLKTATFSSKFLPLCLLKPIKSCINFTNAHFQERLSIIVILSDLCRYNQAELLKCQTKIRIWENKIHWSKKCHLKSKTYNMQFVWSHKLLVFYFFDNMSFCLQFPLLLSHWSDFCPHCQLCGYAACSLVCAAWLFVCSSDTNLSSGQVFFRGASPLTNMFLSDISVPWMLFSAASTSFGFAGHIRTFVFCLRNEDAR